MDVIATHLHARFPTRATLEAPNRLPRGPLRDCHPLWYRPSTEFGLARPGVPESKHHTSSVFRRGIRFALYPLRSPLLRASRLISRPPHTRMLRSRGFPFLTERPYGHEVAFGDRRIAGSLRLPDAFRRLARPSSAPEPSHSPDSELAANLSSQHTSRLSMIGTNERGPIGHGPPAHSTLPRSRPAAWRVHALSDAENGMPKKAEPAASRELSSIRRFRI